MQNVVHPTSPALPAANVSLATEQATASFGGYLVRQLSNVSSVFQNMSFSTAVLNTCRTGCDVAVRAVSNAQSFLGSHLLPALMSHSYITSLGTSLPVLVPAAQMVSDTMKTRSALGLKHLQQQNAQLQNRILATDVEATEKRRDLVTQHTEKLKSHAEKFKALSERSLFTAENARSFALLNLAPLALLPQIGVPMATVVVVGSAIAHVVGHKVSGWYNRQAVEQINHLVADAEKNLAVENMYQTKVTELQNKITELQGENTDLQERLVKTDIANKELNECIDRNSYNSQLLEIASEKYARRLRGLISELTDNNTAQQKQLSSYEQQIGALKLLLAKKNEKPEAVGGKDEEFFDVIEPQIETSEAGV